MINNKTSGFVMVLAAALLLLGGCKKMVVAEAAMATPPVRTYIVTARVDKKGTNSNSEGTAVLKGTYDESTKMLEYTLECKNVDPQVITLRSGAKGTTGSVITEIYKRKEAKTPLLAIKGQFILSPLQERNLLKGQWFVAISTLLMNPEISGILTLKQK